MCDNPETTESRKEKRKVTEEVRDRPKTSAENPRKVVNEQGKKNNSARQKELLR